MIITDISIDMIKIDNRLWEVEQEHITPIVDSIKQVGLINPISVLEDNGKYMLVAGEHRLRAYMELGKDTIPAHIFKREYEDIELDKAKCILMEVDENLIRRSSDRFEESYMLYQRKIAYETLYPGSNKENITKNNLFNKDSEGCNGSTKNINKEIPKSFIQDTEEKTGIKKKYIGEKIRIGSRIYEEDGKKADELGVTNNILKLITKGEDNEKVKDSSKIHIDTIDEINKNFTDIYSKLSSDGKRNSFYENSYNKFVKEKEKEFGEKFHLNNPIEFAEELKEKIINEYLPEYLDTETGEVKEDPKCIYEKTENILICDSTYAKQFPEVCERFITLHVNTELEFGMVNKVTNTFGQDVKIAIVCLDANVFSKYINYKNS